MHTVHKPPLYIYYLYIYFLYGGCSIAAPPPPPMAMPPFGGVRTSLPLGLFWGALPDPPDPPETPTKGSSPRADALATLGLSAPKG